MCHSELKRLYDSHHITEIYCTRISQKGEVPGQPAGKTGKETSLLSHTQNVVCFSNVLENTLKECNLRVVSNAHRAEECAGCLDLSTLQKAQSGCLGMLVDFGGISSILYVTLQILSSVLLVCCVFVNNYSKLFTCQ